VPSARRNGGLCLRRLVECRAARWQPGVHLCGATHTNSASEPNMRFLSVGRDRPTPGAGGSPACPAESRFVPSAIGVMPRGSLTTLPATADRSSRLTGATHRCRCHSPLPVPPTFAGATHPLRCHPPLLVPPTFDGATHPIRPTSRMCGFLGSGGLPDTSCRRIACFGTEVGDCFPENPAKRQCWCRESRKAVLDAECLGAKSPIFHQ
jgi:hypothetical protein